MALITTFELDQMTCDIPDCDCDGKNGLYLGCRHCMNDIMNVHYKNGSVRITCAVCDQLVLEIDVSNSLMRLRDDDEEEDDVSQY